MLDHRADLPSVASVWAELGAAGRITAVYRDGRPESGVDADRLRAELARLDNAHDVGLVLGICVQLATILPLLRETSPGSAATENTLAGTTITALAATDSGPGSDLTALTTRVDRTRDGLVVTGSKMWITNALTADWLLVLARHRPGPHFTNFTWLLVPAGAPGVSVDAADTDLFVGSGVGHMHLDAVTLPPSAVLGGLGRGLPLFARHIAIERLAGAYWATSVCHRALTMTKKWLANRGELWRQPVVRDRFARALLIARQLDALTTDLGPQLAIDHDQGLAALLKAAAGTTVRRVLDECSHLQGAAGFDSSGIQRLRAESAMFGIAGGTSEIAMAGIASYADQLLAGFVIAGGSR